MSNKRCTWSSAGWCTPSQRSCIYWPAACCMQASVRWWGWCTPAPAWPNPWRKRGRSRPAADRHCRWRCLVPPLAMLRGTRLQTDDLRITVPAPWSRHFACRCFWAWPARLTCAAGCWCAWPGRGRRHPAAQRRRRAVRAVFGALRRARCGGGTAFPRALQGLMRPSGSAAAIFGPALLFGLLHLDLAQA